MIAFLTPRHKKAEANQLVSLAVRHGQIKREPCVKCGAEYAYAHHEDYSKPFDIAWLCPQHHADRHKELRKIHNIVIVGKGCWRKHRVLKTPTKKQNGAAK